MDDMIFTKEYCIKMHRKMWNWIAKKIEKENTFLGIYNLKKIFWKENGLLEYVKDPSLYTYCFCCLYACMKNNTDIYENKIHGYESCKDCLMCWNSSKSRHQCCDEQAEYKMLNNFSKEENLKEIVKQCRKIAELFVNLNT